MFKAEEPMHSTEQAPTEEQKEAYNKAVNDYDELLSQLAEKRTTADDLKYEIDDINHQVEARGQLDSFANAAGEAI
jgi:predicted  nucleic acid-binding Zn-ribbon protein